METLTAREATKSPLLRLPVEIRATVWDHYFNSLDFQLLSTRNTNPSKKRITLRCRSNAPDGQALSLLAVSWQVRREALPHLSQSHFTITALFPGWHQASRDILSISYIHSEHIRQLELRFLDSNFSVLPSLPNLDKISIVPPGELRCRRWSTSPANDSSCWTREEIDGERGRDEMKSELATSMKLMHDLIRTSRKHMKFEIYFSVGFKFLIKPLHWSNAGRLLSTKGNFHSVVCTILLCQVWTVDETKHCEATGQFDSKLGVHGDTIEICSVKCVQS